jgi:hypothetical protein
MQHHCQSAMPRRSRPLTGPETTGSVRSRRPTPWVDRYRIAGACTGATTLCTLLQVRAIHARTVPSKQSLSSKLRNVIRPTTCCASPAATGYSGSLDPLDPEGKRYAQVENTADDLRFAFRRATSADAILLHRKNRMDRIAVNDMLDRMA